MGDRELRVVLPEPKYTVFDAQRDGLPEVVVVNESLFSFLEIEAFPWHLRVTLEARELGDNGMPTPEESVVIAGVGDEIEAKLLQGLTGLGAPNALFLARSTWNAGRELEYQVHDPKVAHAALQGLLEGKEWAREWQYEMKNDPQWAEAGRIFQLYALARGSDA